MKRWMALATVVVLGGCGGDGTGPSEDAVPPALAAEWYTGASCYPQCGLTLEMVANPADSINFTLGSTTTLRLTRRGSYTMQIVGAGDTTITGTARAEGSYLVLGDATGADTADYVLEGDFLSLRWRRTVTFTDARGQHDARLRGRFRKR